MTLPPITDNQQQILTLLYTYRFLTRPQLHRFIGHSDIRSLHRWLFDLQRKKYIERQFDTDLVGRTRPATYYLGRNGIRWLRMQGKYPESELIKRYREPTRTQAYIETNRLVAQLGATMAEVEAAAGNERYFWAPPTDYNTWGSAYESLIGLKPSLVFIRHTFSDSGHREAPYLLEIVRRSASPLYIRQRLTAYLRYLSADDWDGSFQVSPTVLFVCPDRLSLKAAKRQTRRLLGDETHAIPIRFTTIDTLAGAGIRSPIWEPASRRAYPRE